MLLSSYSKLPCKQKGKNYQEYKDRNLLKCKKQKGLKVFMNNDLKKNVCH